MNLLSRLFGKRRQNSVLEIFLQKTTFDSPRQSYCSVNQRDLKLPSAISTWALHISHRFCTSLRYMLERQDAAWTSAVVIEGAVYDAIAVEVAGYCFFHLMNELLGEIDDSDDDKAEEDPYLLVLRTSAALANLILNSKLAKTIDDDYLLKRVVGYSSVAISKETNVFERFIEVLLSSISARKPILRVSSVPVNLILQLTIATSIPIFQSTHLAEFKRAVPAMYWADREGLL